MSACLTCNVPVDAERICPMCGAFAYQFTRIGRLGDNHVADAVTRGLDFYRLLDVPVSANIRTIARRYQQLRARFPDDHTNVQPALAQRLTLLDVAGRVLTDPQLRQQYDHLRTHHSAKEASGEPRCIACGAFLQPSSACPYCGTTRSAAPSAPPTDQPASVPQVHQPSPAAVVIEPIDYYAILGLTPTHIHAQLPSTTKDGLIVAGVAGAQVAMLAAGIALPLRVRVRTPPPQFARPPAAREINAAAQAALHQVMTIGDFTSEERATLIDSIEVGRFILSDNQSRGIYDLLLRDFQAGKTANGQLDTLRHLQTEARAAIGAARGTPPPKARIDELQHQAQHYLDGGKWQQARDLFKDVIQARPDALEAHAGLVCAIMKADDLLISGPYPLNLALASLGALEQLGAALDNTPAFTALFRGLLARDSGDTQAAQTALQQALAYDPQLTLAWRGLAAIALAQGSIDVCVAACQSALATAPHDEPILTLLMGAYLRGKQRNHAADVARQIAENRAGSWTAEAVLREIGL